MHSMRIFLGILICSFSLLFIVSACDKPVIKYNSDFEGQWRTILVYDSLLQVNVMNEIVIEGKDGSFKNTCAPCGADLCNCLNSSVGKATMNSSKTHMKIGSSNSYPLEIQEEPNIDSTGTWTMLIHGLRYYKQ
ncbi:MAG: hypothetical protein ACI837_000578 [Crocinitomicaceae bacterium]|jgi:hypothetical protein